MEHLGIIISLLCIHFVAVMSPGPDLFMALKNASMYSRRTGVFTAIGFGVGICVHVLYCVAGLAFIISQSIVLFTIVKWIGAVYLLYVGIQTFRSSGTLLPDVMPQQTDISAWRAVRMGLFTNVLNPKVTLFFLSMFTVMISPETPLHVVLVSGGLMAVQTALWFSLVVYLCTMGRVRGWMSRWQGVVQKCFGGVLCYFALRVGLAKQ